MLIKFLRRAMPVGLVCWVIHFVAMEWGITGVLALCLGSGALLALVCAVREGLNPLMSLELARFGLLPGFLAWLAIAPVLSLLGYELETGTRKGREAAITAIRSAMSEPGDLPFHRLRPEVREALDRLPNHPLDRPASIAEVMKLLNDPDPSDRPPAAILVYDPKREYEEAGAVVSEFLSIVSDRSVWQYRIRDWGHRVVGGRVETGWTLDDLQGIDEPT